jgi:alkanesulfonate monooxygenase SsuD/methylene tetrahydromethanopterin reductase-like flavin-dependent oxidoreductase (luciferase family)
MAANADRAVERAAKMADTWIINPHAAMSTIVRQLDLYRATRTEAGLAPPVELPLIREIFCATDPSAKDDARIYLTNKYRTYAGWGQDRVMPETEDFTAPIDDLAADRFIIGSPDECLERLIPWQEQHGVNHFIFRTHWSGMPAEVSLGSMKLLADEVVPALKEAE